MAASTVAPPPEGFVLQDSTPPPPDGFVLEGNTPTAPPPPPPGFVIPGMEKLGALPGVPGAPIPQMEEQSLMDTPLLSIPRPEQATTTAGKVARGGAVGLSEMAEGLTTPANIGILGGTAALNVGAGFIPPLVPVAGAADATAGTYFGAQMAKGALESIPAFRDAVGKGDTEEATRILTGIGLSAAMAATATKHAMGAIRTPLAGRMGMTEVQPPAAAESQRVLQEAKQNPTHRELIANMTDEELGTYAKSAPREVRPMVIKEIGERRRAIPAPPEGFVPEKVAATPEVSSEVQPVASEAGTPAEATPVSPSAPVAPSESGAATIEPPAAPIESAPVSEVPATPVETAPPDLTPPIAEAPPVETTAPTTAPKPTMFERLDSAGQEASARLKERLPNTTSMAEFLNPETIKDMAVSLAGDVARGTLKLAGLGDRLVKEYGPRARLAAGKVWEHIQNVLGDESGQGSLLTGGGKKIAEKAPTVEKGGLSTSPSYDETRAKLIEKVPEELQPEMEQRLQDFEERNPGRKAVTFNEIRAEARNLDPSLVLKLDASKMKAGETLDPAVRFAARETLNSLNGKIADAQKAVDALPSNTPTAEKLARQTKVNEMERQAQKLVDVLIPTRSQDGRNLAYHRMQAETAGFDVEFWMARAKKAMGLPADAGLPADVQRDLGKTLAEGADAEAVATERATRRKKKAAGEPQTAAETLDEVFARSGGKGRRPLTREEVVSQKQKQIISSLEAALRDDKQTADPIKPEEYAGFEANPQIKQLRDALKLKRDLAANEKLAGRDRAQEIADAKKRMVAGLKSAISGEKSTVEPVSAADRLAWESDPEVQKLRATLEAKRQTEKVPVTSEVRTDKAKERTLQGLQDKIDGKPPKAPGEWALTAEERKAVANDPEVQKKKMELARKLADLDKTGLMDTVLALRAAGLLTGVKTHLRNLGGNTAFQVLEEASRAPAAVVDFAMSMATGRRTVQGPSLVSVARASSEASTRGMREAGQIMKTGATAEQLAHMDIPKELNSGNKFVDAYANTIFRLLSAEDRVFRVFGYERSLQEQMKLAKVTTPTDSMRAQAMADAEFSTFNNDSVAANLGAKVIKAPTLAAEAAAKNMGPDAAARTLRAGKAGSAGMRLVFPFVRTPANIIARVLDYSGGGLVRAGTETAAAIANKAFTPEQQNYIARNIGRGVVGPALIYMGYTLSQKGLMTGSREEQSGNRATMEAAGQLPGAIRVGGQWHQIAPFSPVGNLLTIGATLQRESARPLKDEAKRPVHLAAVAVNTVKEQPMLKGTEDTLNAISNPVSSGEQFAGSMAGSFVPTLLSDIAGLADKTRRETRGETLGQSVGRGIASRVPGLRNTLPERRDVFGDALPQTAQSAVDPTLGTADKTATDPVIKELTTLRMGVPKPARKPLETEDEYRTRAQVTGQIIKARLTSMVADASYNEEKDTDARKILLEHQIRQARQMVNDLVKSQDYKEATVSQKKEMLRGLND